MDKATNKYKVLALFGPSGSGKDTVARLIMDSYDCYIGTDWYDRFHLVVRTTTRPMRENEKEGHPYHFVSYDKMINRIYNGNIIEADNFKVKVNGVDVVWCYGTDIDDLQEDKINIITGHAGCVESLLLDSRLDVLPIFIKVDDKQRLIRQLNRNIHVDCSEICRRFLADEKDYMNLRFSYIVVKNDATPMNCVADVLETLDEKRPFWLNQTELYIPQYLVSGGKE